jgi:pyruvate dehydrogenase complex dehydrogenase (E1) component
LIRAIRSNGSLIDRKDSETIKEFLGKHLDSSKPTFIITDIAKGYPSLFKEFFGKNLVHQLCLLHLNKLIVRDFPKSTTMEEELTKYKLLNIFYNRDKEIEFLSKLVEEDGPCCIRRSEAYFEAYSKRAIELAESWGMGEVFKHKMEEGAKNRSKFLVAFYLSPIL